MSKSSEGTTGMNVKEIQFLAVYFKHLKSSDANWDAICEELNYDRVKSAKEYFRIMKIKHGMGGSDATPKKKKRPADDADDDMSPAKSPTKKGRKIKGKEQ